MADLLGEYDCKLDAKGRMLFPAGLRKQLSGSDKDGFVINRDLFDSCLLLYTQSEWKKVSAEVNSLNRFVARNVQFIRRFHNGATRVELDSAGRLLVPQSLAQYAGLDKEVKVIGSGDRIELWSAANYAKMMDQNVDMAALAEEVLGNKRTATDE